MNGRMKLVASNRKRWNEQRIKKREQKRSANLTFLKKFRFFCYLIPFGLCLLFFPVYLFLFSYSAQCEWKLLLLLLGVLFAIYKMFSFFLSLFLFWFEWHNIKFNMAALVLYNCTMYIQIDCMRIKRRIFRVLSSALDSWNEIKYEK